MSYLLDTNVISEFTRKKPNSQTVAWLRTLPLDEQYLSVLSIGEIRNGVERLAAGADQVMLDKENVRQWLINVGALRDHLLTPVYANGSPAVAVYRQEAPGRPPTAFAIHVLDVIDGRIGAIRSFLDPALFELFELPALWTSSLISSAY